MGFFDNRKSFKFLKSLNFEIKEILLHTTSSLLNFNAKFHSNSLKNRKNAFFSVEVPHSAMYKSNLLKSLVMKFS